MLVFQEIIHLVKVLVPDLCIPQFSLHSYFTRMVVEDIHNSTVGVKTIILPNTWEIQTYPRLDEGFARWHCLPMQETQEMQVRSLGREEPSEKEMATHSSILAWKIPWTEEPGGLQSMGSERVRRN